MPLGSARSVGVGSSFGAMGGDFSVISINPAGLGTYFKSEFVLTPGMGFTTADASLNGGNSESNSANGFGIDNLGYVSSSFQSTYDPEYEDKPTWIASNFAIGLTKSKSLKRTYAYSGTPQYGFLQRQYDLIGGRTVGDIEFDNGFTDVFESLPAFDAGAIYPDGNGNLVTDYQELFDIENSASTPLTQDVNTGQLVEESGYINELALAYAANYKNKLNIGISMGLPFVSFTQNKTLTEDSSVKLSGQEILTSTYVFGENLTTTGLGVNFKAGLIYSIIPKVRLGAAVHSPTWYSLTDDFFNTAEYSNVDRQAGASFTGNTITTEDGNFSYTLASPWKFVGSIGTLLDLGKVKGFVNADVEYIDYGSSSFGLEGNNFGDIEAERELNEAVANSLGSGLNIRLGAEFAMSKFRVRGGYAINHDPYMNGSNNALSAGFGYRGDSFFFDMGYRLTSFDDVYIPYLASEEQLDPVVDITTNRGRLVTTFGFKF